MAGADFVVVPSRFEPCGLVAQAGVRYGAVPIVSAVGGLKDLVTPEVIIIKLTRRAPHVIAATRSLHYSACWHVKSRGRIGSDFCGFHHPAVQVGYTLPPFSHADTATDHRQNVQQLVDVICRAVAEYGTPRYQTMQQHCMALDVSWKRPAAEWEQLLERVAAQHQHTHEQAT